MKRLLILLALILPAVRSAHAMQGMGEGPHKGALTAPVASGGGGGSSPAFEVVGSTTDGTTVTSATATITTTANTKKLLAFIGWRRNAGQNINGCTFNGVAMTTTEADAGATSGHNSSIFYLSNPGAVTNGNLSCTMSASVPGLGISAAAFTGATVIASTGTGSGTAITTSSATATANANDILVSFMVKQDPTTSDPTLTTAGALLKINYTFSSTGNGGFFKMAILTCASGSNTVNYTWTTAARATHSWLVLQP